MQRDEVGALEEVFEFDLLDADVLGAFRRQERIERDHFHAKTERAVGNDRTDVAAADHAQRLAGDLDPHEAVLLPLAGLGGSIGLGNFARQCQHQGNRVFGRGDRIAERGVHHDDPLRRRGGNLHIVDTDPGASDHFQPLRLLQDFRGGLGRGTDREAIVIADDLRKLVLVLAEVGLEIDVDAAIPEDLHGGGRQGVGNKNFGFRHLEFSFGKMKGRPGRSATWREEPGPILPDGGWIPGRAAKGRLPRTAIEKTYAAFGSEALVSANAQSIHCVSSATSFASTVAPHQIRKPAGASR